MYFSICRGGVSPPAILFGQPRTSVPTVRKRTFMSSLTPKALRARRVKQTARWAVCSQSGEQFIIATWGVSRDTVAVVVTNDFFASFFFAWKKKILHTVGDACPYSERKSVYFLSYQKVLMARVCHTKYTQKTRSVHLPHISRKPTSFKSSFPTQKFFAYFFSKKYGEKEDITFIKNYKKKEHYRKCSCFCSLSKE